MDRRKFLASSGLAASFSFLPEISSAQSLSNGRPLIKPSRLKKGDTIGLITPASAVNRSSFEKSIENLERLGFKVIYSENMLVKKGFLAGTDQQRLDDLHAMFENPDVKGVICARGGYGSGRLLREINYDLIRSNPKVLLGYSDITALHFAIHRQTGLVTFHGPVGASVYSRFTAKSFADVLIKGRSSTSYKRPKAWNRSKDKRLARGDAKIEDNVQFLAKNQEPVKIWNDPLFDSYSIFSGIAEGPLVGGNLTLMCSIMGTPYDVSFDGKIVFIEDIGESPYRVDRMLTQLLNSGKLDNCSGIALGIFKGCDVKPGDQDFAKSTSLASVLKERLTPLGKPTFYGLPIGHIDDNATLPMGVNASLDAEKGELKLLDSGVI